ncbi:glycan biosynthesis hexose transferase WsfD [Catenulispora acidiphila]
MRVPISPVGLGVISGALMAIRLLVPVPVGMADNNDGSRLLCLVGADAGAVHSSALPYWQYVVERYPFTPSPHHCEPYPSTMLLPAKLAALVHQHILGLAGAIDLRELAVEYCLVVGFVMWVAARLTRSWRPAARGAFLVALFLVLAEATFADYANSPYTETAALWGLAVFSVAGVAASVTHSRQRAAYVVAWVAALFTVGAKVETLTMAIPLCVFFGSRKLDWGRFSGGLRARAIPTLTVLSLVGIAMWQGGAFGGGPNDQQTNVRNELTMTLMPLSGDPGGVATGLGLPHSFGAYSGTSIWSAHPMQQDPAFDPSRVTFVRIAGYLATHPRLTARVLASGSGPFLRLFRTDYYIGDYTKADSLGRPQREDHRIAVISWVANHFAWVGFGGIVAFWIACAIGAVLLRRRSAKGSPQRAFAIVSLTFTAGSVIQYLTAVFGEGNEVTKHLVVSLFCATLAPLWIVAVGIAHRRPAEASAAVVPKRRESPTYSLDRVNAPYPSGDAR